MGYSPCAVIGQEHGGVIGFLQRHVLLSLGCIWFDRGLKRGREETRDLLLAKVCDPNRETPVLIFPEGVCVNNEYCLMFKKGAFELGATIVPVAIHYNKHYADAYWNTKEQSFLRHIWRLMTSWCLVADVWFMDPVTIAPGESSAEFAGRVKEQIAKQAKLVNMTWDGYLKHNRIKNNMTDISRRDFLLELQSKRTPRAQHPMKRVQTEIARTSLEAKFSQDDIFLGASKDRTRSDRRSFDNFSDREGPYNEEEYSSEGDKHSFSVPDTPEAPDHLESSDGDRPTTTVSPGMCGHPTQSNVEGDHLRKRTVQA